METRIERVVLETDRHRIVGDLTLPKEGYRSRLSDYLNGGDVRVMLVWFNASADRQEAWLNVGDAITAINAIPASGDGARRAGGPPPGATARRPAAAARPANRRPRSARGR